MSARLKAFAIHIAVSLIVALHILVLVFYFWYPQPLDAATGVTDIFLMMLAIDVIVGPIFTLLVYKVGKKTLKLDLAVIALLQICALSYGLWVVGQGRPVWMVYNVGRFDLVRLNDLDLRQITKAKTEYQQPSWLKPQWVAAVAPKNTIENNDITFEAVFAGVDLPQRPNLYMPLTSQKIEMKKHLKPLKDLDSYNAASDIRQKIAAYPQADSWLPLKALQKDMVVLLRQQDAHVIAVVDLKPWS
jgi:hypothetical protein